jgi:hypothetical protein
MLTPPGLSGFFEQSRSIVKTRAQAGVLRHRVSANGRLALNGGAPPTCGRDASPRVTLGGGKLTYDWYAF